MFGKIVQLRQNQMLGGLEVVYGIEVSGGTKILAHNTILNFGENNLGTEYYTDIYGYSVIRECKLYKEILIAAGELDEQDVEQMLFVIVEKAEYIETNAKKVSGNAQERTVLEMHDGDSVEVTQIYGTEKYIVVRKGNRMFLEKEIWEHF